MYKKKPEKILGYKHCHQYNHCALEYVKRS